ncbi:hypothetical protein [Roseofilum casamattae]|uniref:SMODS and SLOG-associating 2TM effector domain-containing protein n=1 Tax=Roseofilum casamattae BLCC-M143 TaxID=3022442 RepID=A0ABT7C2Z8_9CYAN|nr:hypothetical protein [Roseofilum casamattae]MDJ1185837.1 hypothetical protein [Roseofilum casamattae BLCC-M143]
MSQHTFLSLQISQAEILQASHLKQRQLIAVLKNANKNHNSFIYLFLGIGVFIMVGLYAFYAINGSDDYLSALAIFSSNFFIWLIIIFVKISNCKKEQYFYQRLAVLNSNIQDYNSLINGIDTLDEAERSSGTNRSHNREQVMEALQIMKADLICALRIDKTFRENPNLSSTDFNMNLEPLRILQIDEQASQYGNLFGQALQIGMSVQEEMQSLQRKSY